MGIGCDATNPNAVRRVFEIKQRDDAKALITLIDSEAKLEFYVREVPEVAWQLIDVAERPLTIIYDGARNLAPNLWPKMVAPHTYHARGVQPQSLYAYAPSHRVYFR